MTVDEFPMDEWLFKLIDTHGGEGVWHEVKVIFRITDEGVLQVDQTILKRLPHIYREDKIGK